MKQHIVFGAAAVAFGMMFWFSSPHLQAESHGRHALSPAVQARVDCADQLLREGQQARRAGDTEAAERELQECVKQHTAAASFALEELARLYETEGRTDEAIHAYHDMIHPPDGTPPGTFGSAFARIHYATMLNGAGRWPEAVQAYRDILRSPDMPYNQGSPATDEPILGAQFDLTMPQPKAMQAMLHVVLGRRYGKNYKEALPQFEQAVAIDPSLAIAHFYKGYALQGQGQFAEAQAAFQKAAALDTEGTVRAAAAEHLRAVQAHRQ